MNFEKQLKRMRKKYARKPLRFIELKRPAWADDLVEESTLILKEKDILIKDGILCYAYIVQANVVLFSTERNVDSACNLIYSTDEIIAKQPQILVSLAHEMGSYKNKDLDEVPEQWKDISRILTAEHGDSYTELSFSSGDTPFNVYFNANMIHRKLLPGEMLHSKLLPVLALPGRCKSVLILPPEYWTGSFKRAWLKGKF